MDKGINVVSLFDGMSCGQIALERSAIKVDNYFASEVDKHAITVTMANYPNTIQLGDVRGVKGQDLPFIDLLIGGSPCQGFSFAGKQLNFDDPRSALFFEYVRILKELRVKNPNLYFLLENVKMKKEYQDVISGYLGVEPIEINSALVSAQNRIRLYWTNIEGIEQPEDRGVLLKDILENLNGYSLVNNKYFYYQNNINLNFNTLPTGFKRAAKRLNFTGDKRDDKTGLNCEGYECNPGNKAYCLTTVEKTRKVLISRFNNGLQYRNLTLLECERLQTVPDNYTNFVSDTQRYKMLGNGWTVDVIAHIFNTLKSTELYD